MPDPTLRILDAIEDPDRYVREPGVPVFVPHVRHGEGGEVEADVSPADLEEIARTANEKAAKYGVLVRVTRGHVRLHKPDEPPPPEDEQPPIWGWAKDFRVGRWGPQGGNVGLLADIYFDKRHHAAAMTYPFRSAEYYPETGEITGVGLLRRDPELDLGLLTYARRGRPERGGEATMPTEDDYLDDELPAEDDQEQYADDHLEPDGDEMGDEEEGDEFSPEEVEQYARMHRYNHQAATDALAGMGDDDEDRPMMEQLARCYGRLAYGAEGGAPAGGNTFVPGVEGDDDDTPPLDPVGDEDGDEEDMEQYSGSDFLRGKNKEGQVRAMMAKDPEGYPGKGKQTGEGGHYRTTSHHHGRRAQQVQYARQLASLQQQVARQQQQVALLHYEKQLLQLEAQGVEFDLAEELREAADMTPQQRQRHLKRMARHYSRSPVGGGMLPVLDNDAETDRGNRPLTARQKAAALRYMERQGCSWDQAMAWAKQNA